MLLSHLRLKENSHLLQPPVNNYCVHQATEIGMTVMVVGGPNARSDFHINPTPEFFFQHKGSMLLRTVDTSNASSDAPKFIDIPIHENSMFLLPANTPHNPIRFADTVGVVLEQPRPEASVDRMRWYCQECGNVVCEKSFHCTDLGTQVKAAVHEFAGDERGRVCGKCGVTCELVPRGVVQPVDE